ncbi:phosphatase PAP2 family protein [Sulfurirhabdus autotrophica]|uniref:PAP2 superfamily protein n=1 Tax=Sulfurirhabdus autotrophica TaxID=1706046 RepID=A0A4R3XTB2_9PROT|nr:phosphatase PAP2 family protein [Sulfurirhabdus autotrophica]TCV81298.1 PAP2 superfamily protein [Sulfurirhabdus autotrophica]
MKEILYDWNGVNVWLFHFINNIRSEFIDKFMLLGTELGGHAHFPYYLAVFTLAAVIAVSGKSIQEPAQYKEQATSWLIVIAVFSIAYLLDGLLLGTLKPLLDFPRPPLALPVGSVHIIGQAEYHHSLPSGHSSFAMLIVASLWPVLNSWWRLGGIVFVLWIGLSRVSLGAHFPADVVAGFLSSLFVVILVRAVLWGISRMCTRSA